jgi:hypothetical protein
MWRTRGFESWSAELRKVFGLELAWCMDYRIEVSIVKDPISRLLASQRPRYTFSKSIETKLCLLDPKCN